MGSCSDPTAAEEKENKICAEDIDQGKTNWEQRSPTKIVFVSRTKKDSIHCGRPEKEAAHWAQSLGTKRRGEREIGGKNREDWGGNTDKAEVTKL